LSPVRVADQSAEKQAPDDSAGSCKADGKGGVDTAHLWCEAGDQMRNHANLREHRKRER
jgi:hypothetical protein